MIEELHTDLINLQRYREEDTPGIGRGHSGIDRLSPSLDALVREDL